MKPQVQANAYDPRVGQDYSVSDFQTKRTFSSLKHGLYVLDCIGAVDWSSEMPLLTGCIQNTARRLFFMVDPWQPGATELSNALEREFGPLKEFERSLCGYAATDPEAVQQIFRLRESFGGDTTGQWCIGGCVEEFAPPVRTSLTKRQLWDLSLVLEQADKLGCVLSLGEMKQSLFATRLFDGLDNLLRQSPVTRLASEYSTAGVPHKR
ncbi:MAG: hypothetical protein ACK4UN_21565 [Limisphaerales bacterium]|jgi:hypothetical protein